MIVKITCLAIVVLVATSIHQTEAKPGLSKKKLALKAIPAIAAHAVVGAEVKAKAGIAAVKTAAAVSINYKNDTVIHCSMFDRFLNFVPFHSKIDQSVESRSLECHHCSHSCRQDDSGIRSDRQSNYWPGSRP